MEERREIRAVAGHQGALARVVHGHSVEQAGPGENSVYLAVLTAHEHERTVLGLEPPERAHAT
jgi:hypothetical protein